MMFFSKKKKKKRNKERTSVSEHVYIVKDNDGDSRHLQGERH